MVLLGTSIAMKFRLILFIERIKCIWMAKFIPGRF